MKRWMSVMAVVVAPLLLQCNEKKEVVTTTESSSTIGQVTNPSPVPAAPESVPAATTTQLAQPDPVAATASAPPAGPPLRNPAAATPAVDPAAMARRVDLREADLLVSSGEAIMVDVRSPADYAKSHVRGAINIPVSEVQSRASELPRDKLIITYCT